MTLLLAWFIFSLFYFLMGFLGPPGVHGNRGKSHNLH